MTDDHIAKNAAGLAALAPDDPERRAAEGHARGCPACAAALKDGERLGALLDAVPSPPPPSPEALRRASAEIMTELASTAVLSTTVPRARRRLHAAAVAAAVLAAWIVPVALSKNRPALGPSHLTAVATALLAALASAAAFTWGGAALALLPVASGVFSLIAGAGGGLHVATGLKCTLFELIVALLPLGVSVLALRRSTQDGRSPLLLAVHAAAGALAGHAALHFTCPVSTATPHLLVFHTGGVVLAGLLGLAAAAASSTIRSRPRI